MDSHLSRDAPPSYESTIMQRFESFENPMAGSGNRSFGSHDMEEEEDRAENPQFDKALYDFTVGGDDELNLIAGEEVEIEYEVDGWFYVRKKRPRRDGKMVVLVTVLYVSSSYSHFSVVTIRFGIPQQTDRALHQTVYNLQI